MMKVLKCNVNGSDIEISIDERESLADTLRNHLGLTSVKKGCAEGECGACTVLIDGKATVTCLYLSVWAQSKRILTTEGLQDGRGNLHPVQQAFIEKTAVQCGFCIPGIIMTCVEIVGREVRYTREQLKQEIEGHLCRCTGYQNVINAIERAVEIIEEQQAR